MAGSHPLKSALSPSWSGVQIFRELGIQCIDHERHGRGGSPFRCDSVR